MPKSNPFYVMMSCSLRLLPIMALLSWNEPFAAPIKKDPNNPHYFNYNNQPMVLVTTDQHYGAVINMDFDYIAFLDTLHNYGMNLTRIYPGGFFEYPDKFVDGNPLGPDAGRQILPWAKTLQTGADSRVGGYKFDLGKWNEAYFTRFRDFVTKARDRGIIVEIAFFNGNYSDCWPILPLNAKNNINGVGNFSNASLFTTLDPATGNLSDYQAAYISEITRRLNDLDNIIYDICDEPKIEGQSDAQVRPWINKMLSEFLNADTPNKHLIGQTAHSWSPDFTGDSRTTWIPDEYIASMAYTLETDYADNKPLVDVETVFWPFQYGSANGVDNVRVEGWEFLVGGAAGFIQLNSEFSDFNSTGKGTLTQSHILPQKKRLKDFIYGFDFGKMAKFDSFALSPSGAHARAIAESGKQYAFYWHHSSDGWCYTVQPGSYHEALTVRHVPAGRYKAEWVNPATGVVITADTLTSNGGDLTITAPTYSIDIALRMILDNGMVTETRAPLPLMRNRALFSIFNVKGQCVRKFKCDYNGTGMLNIRVLEIERNLPAGIYLWRISGQGYRTVLKRVVIR